TPDRSMPPLHDALPIYRAAQSRLLDGVGHGQGRTRPDSGRLCGEEAGARPRGGRSRDPAGLREDEGRPLQVARDLLLPAGGSDQHTRQAEVAQYRATRPGAGIKSRRPTRLGWSPQPVPSTGVMRALPPAGPFGFASANPASCSGSDLDGLEQVAVGNEPLVPQGTQHPAQVDLARGAAMPDP